MSLAAPPLRITGIQREQLEAWSRSRVVPHRHRQVLRARIVLMAADGVANQVIAERLGTPRPSVLKWRARFQDAGIDGLEEADGRGPKPTYGQDFVEQVIATALRPPEDGSTHWSTRSLAQQLGASHATVHRILQDARPPASSHPDVQVQPRSAPGGEGQGCRGPVHEPARERDRAER